MAEDQNNTSKNILGKAIDLVKASNEKFGKSTDRIVDATFRGGEIIARPIVGAIEKASNASETLTRSETLQNLKAAVAERANFEYLGNKIEGMGNFISDKFSSAFGNFSLLPPGMPGLKDIGASILKLLGLVGLIALLKSDKFKNFVEKTKEGEGVLGSIYKFFTDDFPNAFRRFSSRLEEFKENKSFSNLISMFGPAGTIALGFAGIAALLNPLRTLKFLTRSVGRFVKMFGKGGVIGKAIANVSTRLKNVLTGTRLNAAGKPISPGGKFVPQAARGVKATTKGVLRAIPGVGLAATAIFGVFDGITAGFNEMKKENSTKLSIAREATAGVLSGLTFGLISQESISGVMTSTGTFFKDMFKAIPSFDEIKEGIGDIGGKAKDMFKGIIDKVPSMDEIKTMLTGVGATAADFASKISDMLPSVDDLMSFLPNKDDILGFIDNITPSFLKDPTAAEKVLKLEGKLADKISEIEKHQAEIDQGDMRTAMGFSREAEIKDLEKEIAQLRLQMSDAKSQVIQNNIDASQSASTHQHGTRTIPIGASMHPMYARSAN